MNYQEFFEKCRQSYRSLHHRDVEDRTSELKFKTLPRADIRLPGLVPSLTRLFDNEDYVVSRRFGGQTSFTDHLNDRGLDAVRGDVNSIADQYFPRLETEYFGCHLLLMQVQLCRSIVDSSCKPVLSELWHYDDGFPATCYKLMVYLTDVDNDGGPFEIARRNGKVVEDRPTREGTGKWETGNYKRTSHLPNKLKDCKVDRITGVAGTAFAFSQAIWHKRSQPTKNERIALVLNFRPYNRKMVPYFGDHTTKWANFPPIQPDPLIVP